MAPAEIFDRVARRRARDRAATMFSAHDFLHVAMRDSLLDRLTTVKRSFADVLDLGCADARLEVAGARILRCDAGFAFAHAGNGVQADEDRLPFADASFDLVASVGVLDTVNDLPGALTLIRRILRPNGLFLAAFAGAGSLPQLRAALRRVESSVPRLHPLIDVRSAGDLLLRAGFTLPVADIQPVTVRYPNLERLTEDLRGMAAGNVLRDRYALDRTNLFRLAAAFADRADTDGRVSESFEIVNLTGWAPSPELSASRQPPRRMRQI